MYLERTLEPSIRTLSNSFPVLLLTGPRQVGKTTLLKNLAAAEDRRIVTLDEMGPRALAIEDPLLFLQRYEPPVLIDEVQHAPGLLEALKVEVDRDGEMGRFWLTGSQHFSLMRGVSESLAGRVGLLRLSGLSYPEQVQAPRQDEPFRPDRVDTDRCSDGLRLLPLFERIVHGRMPRLAHPDAPPWEAFYGSYVQTYLERDVRSMLNVADLAAFQRFVRLAAARVGQLINYSDLARDTGIAVSTAREWLSVLEASQQIVLLRPYFENLSKRQIKTPKLYFMDSGLACYLAGWKTPETAASGAMAGPLFENWVVAELMSSFMHRGMEPPLWFFRDKERREVDVVIAEDGALFPIEVKLAAAPTSSSCRGIAALERHGAPVSAGAIICLSPAPYAISATLDALPANVVW